MGIVFLAEDTRLGRQVALKVMHADMAQDTAMRERFLREARSAANIRSDHVVAIHEIGFGNDVPFLVTELLQGTPLNVWLKENPAPAAPRIVDFALQIARGLEACHQAGVIHRDIKPSNIWVEAPSLRVKILDFGLARASKAGSELTLNGEILGTPAYMAPEQAEGHHVDERCDLFSLGCVLYQMASGVKPFDGSSVVAILRAVSQHEPTPLTKRRADLPSAFCDLVMRLLAKAPDDRPASASTVVETLLAMPDNPGNALPPSSPSSTLSNPSASRRPLSRRYRRIVCLAGVLSLTSVLSLSTLWLVTGDRSAAPAHESALKANAAKTSASTPLSSEANSFAVSTTPGVTNDEIRLGMSAPFSGPARELGRAVEVGLRTYFEHVNDQGGMAGRKIKLVSLDDGYQPERALANMKELFEQSDTFAVIGNVGTPTAEMTMPYAQSKQRIFFGGFTGAPLLRRDPPDRYVFNFRASYAEETAAIVRYLVDIKGLLPEQIAVFTQQDGYGDAGFEGVAKTMRKLGRKPDEIVRVGHHRNSSDVRAAVQELVRHPKIRAVVMVSTYRPAAQFIRQLKDAKAELLFANVSFVGSEALAEELMQMGAGYAPGVIVTQVVPHPVSQASLVLKYRELLQKYHPNEKANFGSLEGYISAAIFTEGLRRAGKSLTTETLVDALESIRNFDVGLGTPLHFGPSEHQASHRVWGTALESSGRYQILDLE
jgi:serine/threonine protein kinase